MKEVKWELLGLFYATWSRSLESWPMLQSLSTSTKFIVICTSLTFFTSSTLSKMLTSIKPESLHFFQCIFWSAKHNDNWVRLSGSGWGKSTWTACKPTTEPCHIPFQIIASQEFFILLLVGAEVPAPVAKAFSLCTALIPALLLFGEVLLWLH